MAPNQCHMCIGAGKVNPTAAAARRRVVIDVGAVHSEVAFMHVDGAAVSRRSIPGQRATLHEDVGTSIHVNPATLRAAVERDIAVCELRAATVHRQSHGDAATANAAGAFRGVATDRAASDQRCAAVNVYTTSTAPTMVSDDVCVVDMNHRPKADVQPTSADER